MHPPGLAWHPVHSIGCCALPIAMSCTPEAMQGTPTAMSRIGCGASSGHRMRWRTSGALHSARWSPLPGRWCARRAPRVRWCAPPGVAVRIVVRSVRAPTRAGGPTGARTTAWWCASWRARRVPGGARAAATRGRIERSPYITHPLDFRPLEIPYARYADPECAADHTNRREGGSGGPASVGQPSGAHRLGQTVRWVRAPRMWCAHQGPAVRAPSPPCAHHDAHRCGGREWTTSPWCAPARTMLFIVAARCAPPKRVRAPDASMSRTPRAMLAGVEPTRCRGGVPSHPVHPRNGLHSHRVDPHGGLHSPGAASSTRRAVESTVSTHQK